MAPVGSLIARLDKEFNLEETIAGGISGSGRGVIPEEPAWTECTSSLAAGSGLFRLYAEVNTILWTEGQSTMVIMLEGGLRK